MTVTVLVDVVRLLVAFVGTALAAWQVRLALTNQGAGWRAHLGVAIGLLILCGSRIENLGRPITWQFVGTTTVVVLLVWSSYRRYRGLDRWAEDDDEHQPQPPPAGIT